MQLEKAMQLEKQIRARVRKLFLLTAALCASVALPIVADVVQGLNAPNGTLAVDSDTTVLTNGFDATLPEALATNAVLWFSADKNVITNEGGGVTEWRDVREAADAETRLYNAALAYLPEEDEAGRLKSILMTPRLQLVLPLVVDQAPEVVGKELCPPQPAHTA